MPGIKIVLPIEFSDPDDELPVLTHDGILTRGSIALFDLAHSHNPLAAGVPLTTSAIPNLAWEQAAAAHGSGDESAWALTYIEALLTGAGQDGKVERTPKGGLHVIMSQSTGVGSNKGVHIGSGGSGATPLLSQYLQANWSHAFYLSLWQTITRAGLDAGAVENNNFTIHNRAVDPNISHFLLRGDREAGYGADVEQRNDPALPQGAGVSFRSIAVSGPTGTAPAAAGAVLAALAAVGATPANFGSIGLNKSRSAILYRGYLEDLTVSGRTFAEVDAIDHALWTAAFGTGGRYAGDTTPTAPSAYP